MNITGYIRTIDLLLPSDIKLHPISRTFVKLFIYTYVKSVLGNRQDSTTSMNDSDITNSSDASASETSSLLLRNLNAATEWEKSILLSNKSSTFNSFGNVRSHYSSKVDPSRNSLEKSESFLLSDNRSLRQHTEQMKRSIKIAVARAARDSNVAARRDTHVY